MEDDINKEATKFVTRLKLHNQIGKVEKSGNDKPDREVRKIILKRFGNGIRLILTVFRLKNTEAAINWFNGIEYKKKYRFLQSDVREIYHSLFHKVY